MSGTIYDYAYDAKTGRETSKRKADSVDSYAATFFTLARALYDTRDAYSRQYVATIRGPLETMGSMELAIEQRDGMTIALPDYPVAYLMDNSEVYRGLRDLAYLERVAFHNANAAARFDAAARRIAAGIATLWYAPRATYDEEKQEPDGPVTHAHWSTWYPDATAQLFPMLQGVIAARSGRGAALWSAFNAAYPKWDRFGFPDAFPWALVGATAVVEGDSARAAAYSASVQKRFAPGFPWPWYDLEAGWYVRMLAPTGNLP